MRDALARTLDTRHFRFVADNRQSDGAGSAMRTVGYVDYAAPAAAFRTLPAGAAPGDPATGLIGFLCAGRLYLDLDLRDGDYGGLAASGISDVEPGCLCWLYGAGDLTAGAEPDTYRCAVDFGRAVAQAPPALARQMRAGLAGMHPDLAGGTATATVRVVGGLVGECAFAVPVPGGPDLAIGLRLVPTAAREVRVTAGVAAEDLLADILRDR